MKSFAFKRSGTFECEGRMIFLVVGNSCACVLQLAGDMVKCIHRRPSLCISIAAGCKGGRHAQLFKRVHSI